MRPGEVLAIFTDGIPEAQRGEELYDEERLREVLSPEHFVRVRRTLGGPAPEVTALAIEQSRTQLANSRQSLDSARARLAEAHRQLHTALEAL